MNEESLYGVVSTVGYGAGIYALFAGATVLAVAGSLLAVVLHTVAVRKTN